MIACDKAAKILEVPANLLKELDEVMVKKTGRSGVLERLCDLNERTIASTLDRINSKMMEANHIRGVLRRTVFNHEKQFLQFLSKLPGDNDFERAVNLASRITTVRSGFFLKTEYLEKILRERPSRKLLDYLGYADTGELLAKEDIVEVFSALRFIESDEWMHETFEKAYSGFTAADFEERPIEVKVLRSRWLDISKKFVAKKHHNVSHLKEFGVIFLNPVKEDVPGKFLRDFALLLHYFHEISFYSKLFRRYSKEKNFAERFKALLRGDVLEVNKVKPGEWLIVQRYLEKINPRDPRLYFPRVNPESMHWLRGERDLAKFAIGENELDLELWQELDWVGGFFSDGRREELVSFDLEDNAMSLVSFMEGEEKFFTYHQKEAMWTRIFEAYVGGEDEMERLLIENFDKGMIKF